MPLYTFSNPKTGEIKEVFFHMNDEKAYQDEDGLDWVREYGSPQLNTNGTTDPWSSKSFVDKTSKGGTMGDLLDRSADLSKERASQNGGVDQLKKNIIKNIPRKEMELYTKTKNPHPSKTNTLKLNYEHTNI